MGVNKKKIIVTGHPLIEQCFYSKNEDTADIYKFLGIPQNCNYLLFNSLTSIETTTHCEPNSLAKSLIFE